MSTSDESATRVWRPLGTRIAAIAFGIAFFVVCTVFWVALDPEIKATFTVPQRATLIVLGLMMAAALHAMARSRIESRPEGLVVVNGYKRREFAWAEVLGITLPRGAPGRRWTLPTDTQWRPWGSRTATALGPRPPCVRCGP